MKNEVDLEWENVFWKNLPNYILVLKCELEKAGFKSLAVGDSLQKLSFSLPKGLKSKEIQSDGEFPVISQSKEYIIGYSDREDLTVNEMLPLIVFGDHSKTIKYVEMPFVIGADGVKLLKPSDEFNVKYYFYFLHGVITDTKDYGRHFKLLREGEIPLIVDLNTQTSIVNFLEDLESKQLQEKEYFDIEIERKITSLQENQVKGNHLSTELTHQLDLVKQLRQAFLREAMQGKLVPQSRKLSGPNDEPASVLLEKIKAEKDLRQAQGTLKKQKPLPPITEEEIPFEIPENWVWCRLGELASIVRGGSPRPAGDPRYYGGNIPFLKVGDLTGYEGKFCETHTYTIKEEGLYKTRFVEANTLMLTNSGATLGVPRICTFPTTFNDGIAAFLGIDNLNKEFLFYFLREKSDYFLSEASRGQGQPNLNTDIISFTLIGLPPVNEQQRIVAKLDELLQYCDDLEASIKESQQQNELLLQQVLREALEPASDKSKADRPKEREV